MGGDAERKYLYTFQSVGKYFYGKWLSRQKLKVNELFKDFKDNLPFQFYSNQKIYISCNWVVYYF